MVLRAKPRAVLEIALANFMAGATPQLVCANVQMNGPVLAVKWPDVPGNAQDMAVATPRSESAHVLLDTRQKIVEAKSAQTIAQAMENVMVVMDCANVSRARLDQIAQARFVLCLQHL